MKNRQKNREGSVNTETRSFSVPELMEHTPDFVKDYKLQGQDKTGALLEGVFSLLKVPSGFKIHAVDGVATQDLASTFVLPPCFSITIFLGGYTEVSIDGQPVRYGTDESKPRIQVQYNETDINISRRSIVGQHMCKVNLSLRDDALQSWKESGFDFKKICSGYRLGSLFIKEFAADTQLVETANSIITIGNNPGLRDQIELERHVLEVFERCISSEFDKRDERQLIKAQKARNYIDEHLTEELSLSIVAKEAGMSISNLQRSFKAAFGCTAINYLRQQRLRLAQKLLLENDIPIAQIAEKAGYTSLSNFSAAFRKHFGVPPSKVRH